ncbi:MAG: site-specific integrase [Planctomycetes bacterium]|nr:site-specific integrase [Planctomycetota bacterium]
MFFDAGGKRRTLYLGNVSKADAQGVRVKVEALADAQLLHQAPLREVTLWLKGLDSVFYDRLAAVGLAEPRHCALLGPFIDEYIAGRTDLKPGTLAVMKQGRDGLVDHFGAQRRMDSITPGEADGWRLKMLAEKYSEATVRKRTQVAKQVYRAAIRSRLVESDPFADLPSGSRENRERLRFIDTATIGKVLDACPDDQWRLIVLLCRYGGVRCPSEVMPLTWADIDFHTRTIRITSPKTAHHEGKGERTIPLFAELAKPLQAAFDAAPEGSEHVVTKYRHGNANLRSQFERIIARAGVTVWPKPFHNLRASRETELCATFPLHVVVGWIGNTAKIAAKHYLTTTPADMTAGADFGATQNPTQNTTEQVGTGGSTENAPVSVSATNTGESLEITVGAETCETAGMGAPGFEP